MKSFPALLLALALCAGRAGAKVFPENAFSDDARGLTGAQFLKVPPSARFAALSGAGLTLYGAESYFLNPAGAWVRSDTALVSYEALLEGSYRTGLVLSRPAGQGAYSVGLLYNNSTPGLVALDGAGGSSGEQITAYDAAFGLGWARRYGRLDLGLAVKHLRSKLAEASGSSFALDAGLIFREAPPSRTEMSLALRNFGPPLKLGARSAPLPFELGAGLKWKYNPNFNLLMEGRLPSDHAPYPAFAGEWFVPFSEASGFFLRSGFNFKNFEDLGVLGAFAGGFGLKLGGLTFDYAFSPYGDLGAAHRMTAGLAWGGAPDRAPAPSALPAKAGLAVAPFSNGPGVTETEAAVVRNLVEAELVRTGRFTVLERSKLDFILSEKKLAYSGLSEERTAAELGRLTGAQLAVFGTVTKDRLGYRITVSLADAVSAAVLRAETVPVAEDYLFREAARRLAAALAK